MVIPRTLDSSRTLDYLREYLDAGVNSRGHWLLHHSKQAGSGSFLHPTVAPDTAYRFTSGGLMPPEPSDGGVQAISTPSLPDIVLPIDGFLRSNPGAPLICEDASATPTDPYIRADHESLSSFMKQRYIA